MFLKNKLARIEQKKKNSQESDDTDTRFILRNYYAGIYYFVVTLPVVPSRIFLFIYLS